MKLRQNDHIMYNDGTFMHRGLRGATERIVEQTLGNVTGIIGTGAATIVIAWQTFKKYRSEQRGESREIDRLLSALADERAVNAELRQQRNDAWAARDLANDRYNQLFRELSDLRESNARLEERVGYLTQQIDFLKGRMNEQR